jgi:transcriptional regulator with AAA-type ATPase domain
MQCTFVEDDLLSAAENPQESLHLHVFSIEIPLLRERKEDIRLLVEYFMDRYARKAKKIKTVDKKTLRLSDCKAQDGAVHAGIEDSVTQD